MEIMISGQESPVIHVSDLNGDVRIYPNPASYQLNVELPGLEQETARISIFTMSGLLITTTESTQKDVQLDIADLSEGIYIVKINMGGKYVHSLGTKSE